MLEKKIKSLIQINKEIKKIKEKGKRIVFTNGCFDLIHYGHVKYLAAAKKLGDVLVVGINSDSSIKKLKGPKRPIVAQKFRLPVVAALESVDYVVLFSDDTPIKLIKAISPDVLVKGGDWEKGKIVGADFVESNGGRVLTIKFVKGFSTTTIIKKIAQDSC